MQRTLFCIVGRTCAGKDTFVKNLCNKFPELFKPVCSYTTRPKRESETEGIEHHFVTKEEFAKLKETHIPIAYTKIGEYEYMSLKDQLDNENVYVIDPNGISYLREHFPDINLYVIYVYAPTYVRKKRAKLRGDDLEKFNQRQEDEDEQFLKFANEENYDAMIRASNLDNPHIAMTIDVLDILPKTIG